MGLATRRIACESSNDLVIEGTTPRRVIRFIDEDRARL